MRLLFLATILCWFHPDDSVRPTGFKLNVAGVPVGAIITSATPDTLDGAPGTKYCAEVAHTGTFEWSLAAVAEDGTEVPGSNSPRIHYRSQACLGADVNENGAVDLGDVGDVVSRLGTGCGVE